MIEISLTGKTQQKIQFPSEWNELTTEELTIVAQSYLADFETPTHAQAFVFLALLKFRSGIHDIEQYLDAEDCVINGLPVVEFLFKENTLTKQPYPVLRCKAKGVRHKVLQFVGRCIPYTLNLPPSTLQGPDDDFNSLLCAEFEEAESHFFNFRADKDPMHLALLAATLYRPRKWFSKEARPYMQFKLLKNDFKYHDSSKLAKQLIKLPPATLFTIFLWYTGCREQMPLYFPKCYEGSGTSSAPDPMVFTKCIHAAAGVKNGTRNQVRRTLLKELFMELELEKVAAAEEARAAALRN